MRACKRILFLTPSLSSGGAERQMVTLAVCWKKQGLNVEFLVYSQDDFYSHLLEENGIKVHWVNLPRYLNRIIRVRRFIRTGNYDVVISFLEIANFLNNFSAIGFKKRSWKIITGERSSHEKIFHGFRSRLFGRLMRFSDTLVCNSNHAREMWMRHYPRYKDKLRVIYNIVTVPEITSAYLPLRNNRLNIIVVATLYDIKNPVNLLKALALMSDAEREKIHIDWYGKVPALGSFDHQKAYHETMGLIKRHGLSDIIEIHEPTRNIHDRMNEADVVALFSMLEGLPNVIAEGMTIGKPIIMSRVSDYPCFVDDKNGFLCNQENPESIKNAILQAAALTAEELCEMGAQSKDKAARLFTEQANGKKWLDLLEVEPFAGN